MCKNINFVTIKTFYINSVVHIWSEPCENMLIRYSFGLIRTSPWENVSSGICGSEGPDQPEL